MDTKLQTGGNMPKKRLGVKGPQREWLASLRYVERRRGSGYVVTVRRKLGDLSFVWYESRPLPVKAQAEAHAKAVVKGLARGREVRPVVWWTYRVVSRPVREGETVYVGTVRKWIGDGSYVWREISPQDTREDAERIAKQTVEAGRALDRKRKRELLDPASLLRCHQVFCEVISDLRG